MIFIIRGSHANEFELQNYLYPGSKKDITVVTSYNPLTSTTLPQIKLWSPTDLPTFPFRRQILNRLIGGEQWLIGLKKLIKMESNLPAGKAGHRTVLHTAETYSPYTHQAVQLKKAGLIEKLVCTCWETMPFNNGKFTRLKRWKQEAYQYVDLFHTPTLRARDALVKEGVSIDKIKVIPYGVDLTRFLPVKRKPNKRPVILTVARLEKEKGMEDLEIVARSLPQFDFLVLGSGNYHLQGSNYNPRGSNIKISSIRYEKIHKLYQSADLFFLPSRSTPTWEEQYGIALVEAMASGIPIITTNSGAIPEVVGPAGIIVNEKDTQSMIEAISGAIHYDCNTEIIGSAGRARAERLFDSKKISLLLAKMYR